MVGEQQSPNCYLENLVGLNSVNISFFSDQRVKRKFYRRLKNQKCFYRVSFEDSVDGSKTWADGFKEYSGKRAYDFYKRIPFYQTKGSRTETEISLFNNNAVGAPWETIYK